LKSLIENEPNFSLFFDQEQAPEAVAAQAAGELITA
jgi:hypothetical protein